MLGLNIPKKIRKFVKTWIGNTQNTTWGPMGIFKSKKSKVWQKKNRQQLDGRVWENGMRINGKLNSRAAKPKFDYWLIKFKSTCTVLLLFQKISNFVLKLI